MTSYPSSCVSAEPMRVFVCGDVMIGRGIDQILPNPCDPRLFELFVSTATDYVRFAEAKNGPIRAPVDLSYVWGKALSEFRLRSPDVKIINLETSITRRGWPEPKSINYRVSPENAETLRVAGIDCCCLANNHVLDWGRQGLEDTIARLGELGIAAAGAGATEVAAARNSVVSVPGKGRVLVTACAMQTSGVPAHWKAGPHAPGVRLLDEESTEAADQLARSIEASRQPGDVAVVSVHWGPNWGYDVPDSHRRFASHLIDSGVNVVFGHSSHHPKAIEIYRNRPIFYGCGDFLNDYEGINGYEAYRGELALMYFLDIAQSNGDLLALTAVPLRMRCFRLEQAAPDEVEWLGKVLRQQFARFGSRLMPRNGEFRISWGDS